LGREGSHARLRGRGWGHLQGFAHLRFVTGLTRDIYMHKCIYIHTVYLVGGSAPLLRQGLKTRVNPWVGGNLQGFAHLRFVTARALDRGNLFWEAVYFGTGVVYYRS